MHSSLLPATAALLAGAAQAISVDAPHYANPALYGRGAPAAPNGYTPTEVDCPSDRPTVRLANGLSTQESAFLKQRRPNTVQPMIDLLQRIDIPGFDASSYINQHQSNTSALPNIGIACSGGGYRAMTNAAGAVAAFDSRTTGTNSTGQLGGLLQSATYLAGLSGGNWLVGSLYQNNFTSVEDIINANGELWDFTNSILDGPGDDGFHVTSALKYYHQLIDLVQDKNQAGYNTTITDYWGRALSYQLINAPEGGPSYTWSSLQNTSVVVDATAPLPIVIADQRPPGFLLVPRNTTIIEFTPWEMGSWDPLLFAFAPIEYAGTRFNNGKVPDNTQCVRGYDNAGYVMGTSSSLFNGLLTKLNGNNLATKLLDDAIKALLKVINFADNDIADWVNPFYQFNPDTNKVAGNETLTIVDGGENGENIPLHPLIQPVREVDVIFAVDTSADQNNWPTGTSLQATYQRSISELANGTAFPSIPDNSTFINLGLNTRPTFFGCDPHNNTQTLSNPSSTAIAPLIVYLPNSPYTFYSNLSTFNISLTDSQRNSMILNGINIASRANNTQNAITAGPKGTGTNSTTLPSGVTWDTCVGCAIIQRSVLRNGAQMPQACNACFSAYCWNGQTASQSPAPEYEPTAVLSGSSASSSGSSSGGSSTSSGSDTSSSGSTKKSAANMNGKTVSMSTMALGVALAVVVAIN